MFTPPTPVPLNITFCPATGILLKVQQVVLSNVLNTLQFQTLVLLSATTKELAGQEILLLYQRDGKELQADIILGTDENGGYLGVVADNIQLSKYGLWQAPIAAAILMFQLIIASLVVLQQFSLANLVCGRGDSS